MKSGSKSALLASAALLLASTSAHSAAFYCDGTVNSVAVSVDGFLYVSYGGYSLGVVCSISATYFGADKETCKGWFAVIQAAQAQQRTLRFNYDSTVSGNPASCTAIVYGQQTKPYFLQTLD